VKYKLKFLKVSTFAALLVLLLLGGFAPFTQSDSGAEIVRITQVDTSQFPQVTVYIAVVDQEGIPVGINPSRIRIAENGVEIPLNQVQGVGDVGPLTTLLVMDISGSMNYSGKLDAAKAAALAYVDQMRSGDQVGLLTFSTVIEYIQPVTTDKALITEAINSLRAEGDTAMYDALAQGMSFLEPVGGRKAIIALTDGLDNKSMFTPEDVISLIGPTGLSISTIGLGDQELGSDAVSGLDEEALVYLAENAGGVYGYAEDEEGLRSLYQSYATALQSEYVLTYTSPSDLRDGVNRALSISLTSLTGLTGGGDVKAVYNPGGLVPEVSQPASWVVFFSILGILAVLLLLPWGFKNTLALVRGVSGGGGPKKPGKKKAKIKLLD
jgi:VWFA-related protein